MIVTNQQQDLLSSDLELTPSIGDNLLAAAKWGRFIAIAGFIGCGLTVLVGAIILMMGSSSGAAANASLIAASFYIVFAIISFFPCLYLFNFSKKINEAYNSLSQVGFESAIGNLKSLFKFIGILTILMLVFWLLALLGVLANAGKF